MNTERWSQRRKWHRLDPARWYTIQQRLLEEGKHDTIEFTPDFEIPASKTTKHTNSQRIHIHHDTP